MNFDFWCVQNNVEWLLSMWDEEENQCTPSQITHATHKKFCFRCGNPNHRPIYISPHNLSHRRVDLLTPQKFCVGCHSVGQFLEDHYGVDYLNSIWSSINELSPYTISIGSHNDIWLKCLKDSTHPDYNILASNIRHTICCPYCTSHRLCFSNNLGMLHPEVFDVWSEKNTKTPYDYAEKGSQYVWFKCQNNIHPDYQRQICHATNLNYECPRCNISKVQLRGSDNPTYNPNRTENRRMRDSKMYKDWRDSVYKRDDYTCQCCGVRGGRLNVHHIFDFANYKNLRLHIDNGITLCEECHSAKIPNSLHDIYGTKNVGPEELTEYINSRRKEIGIKESFNIEDTITKLRGCYET